MKKQVTKNSKASAFIRGTAVAILFSTFFGGLYAGLVGFGSENARGHEVTSSMSATELISSIENSVDNFTNTIDENSSTAVVDDSTNNKDVPNYVGEDSTMPEMAGDMVENPWNRNSLLLSDGVELKPIIKMQSEIDYLYNYFYIYKNTPLEDLQVLPYFVHSSDHVENYNNCNSALINNYWSSCNSTGYGMFTGMNLLSLKYDMPNMDDFKDDSLAELGLKLLSNRSFDYETYLNRQKTAMKDIKTMCEDVWSITDNKSTETEMAMNLMYRLCEVCDYRYKLNEDGTKSPDSNNGQDIYAAVVEGQAVCGGQAQALMSMLQYSGINAIYSTGYTDLGGHAFVIAELDGEYVILDSTQAEQAFNNNQNKSKEDIINIFAKRAYMTVDDLGGIVKLNRGDEGYNVYAQFYNASEQLDDLNLLFQIQDCILSGNVNALRSLNEQYKDMNSEEISPEK